MKKPRILKKPRISLNKLLLVVAISTALLWVAAFIVCGQDLKVGTPEYYKALGIEPNNRPVYKYGPIKPPSDSCLFVSYYNETKMAGRIIHEPEVAFRFDGRTVTTTLSDQRSRFRIYDALSNGKDSDHEWVTFRCKDNSGSHMTLTVAKEDDVNIIILQYGNIGHMYYEVETQPLPVDVYDRLEDLEALGHIHDGQFGRNYSDEEVYEFLSQLGDPALLLNLMLRDMYYNEDIGVGNTMRSFQFQKREKFIDNAIINK